MRDAGVARAHAFTLFSVFACLLVFGLVMLGSATAAVGQERFHSTYYFLIRQVVFGLVPGCVLFLIFRAIPIHVWERSWRSMWWISCVLLVIVFIPGVGLRINGSLSWVRLGFTSLQTSEVVKFTFIVFLAGWLAQHAQTLRESWQYGFLPYMAYVAGLCVLLIVQPDVGTMLVFFATAVVLAFIAGAQLKHLGVLVIAGLVAIMILIAIAPYRLQRITNVFHPDADPLGSGYHLRQSLVAIGSGGALGLGFGKSRQKFQYVPEVSADSIFAIIAEEMGFVISSLLIIAYAVVIVRGYGLARAAPSLWARYFIIGTLTWLGVQTFLNLGAMLGLLPLTGLPLPLVSHGGSALMVTLAAFGVISAIVLPPQRARGSV